ncbi:MAG: class I SAM-dependent RNA methyltransferase, partial [Clostridia bacterium]|nr:class I SAM-dependent RNA methyltransferase [Clostridia bacterium]
LRTILSTDITHLYGEKEIIINKQGLKVPVNIGSFVQVNDEVSAQLYEYVAQQCNIDDIVFDLYSGAGLMTAMLAQKSKIVFGIESNLDAVNASTKLQQQNNIKNTTNIWGKVEDVFESVLNESIKDKKFKYRNKLFDLDNNLACIIDPPRKGCDKNVLNTILQSPINKIIYVSCNPLTLARDISVLIQNYDITSIKLFDMFNTTSHIETVVVLDRKSCLE